MCKLSDIIIFGIVVMIAIILNAKERLKLKYQIDVMQSCEPNLLNLESVRTMGNKSYILESVSYRRDKTNGYRFIEAIVIGNYSEYNESREYNRSLDTVEVYKVRYHISFPHIYMCLNHKEIIEKFLFDMNGVNNKDDHIYCMYDPFWYRKHFKDAGCKIYNQYIDSFNITI